VTPSLVTPLGIVKPISRETAVSRYKSQLEKMAIAMHCNLKAARRGSSHSRL